MLISGTIFIKNKDSIISNIQEEKDEDIKLFVCAYNINNKHFIKRDILEKVPEQKIEIITFHKLKKKIFNNNDNNILKFK